MTIQGLIYIFVTSFIALFPVMNPISNGFIVNSFLEDTGEEERKIYIRKIAVNTLLVGLLSLAVGHLVLLIFGLAIPVIQIGGGIIICKTGWEWLSDAPVRSISNKEKTINHINPGEIEGRLFYPITFPISIGPGTISVIFTLMATSTSKGNWTALLANYAIIGFVIVILCAILYAFLTQGSLISRKLGHNGSLIINKLVAFITFCIGIQIIISGISKVFRLDIL